MLLRMVPFVLACLLVTGCDRTATPASEGEDAIVVTHRLVLVEPDSAPLTRIQAVAPARDGTLLVLDGVDCRLRRFDAASGALLASTGRCGGGPGEFVMPLSVVADDAGYVYVSDATPRVTRLRHDFTVDTLYPAEPFLGVRQLQLVDGLLIGAGLGVTPLPDQPLPHELLAVDPATGATWTLHAGSPSRHRPYWNGTWFTSIAPLPGRMVVVAGSMEYPLAVVDVASGGSTPFGSPPSSYLPPSQPEMGAFASEQHIEASTEWYASFTDVGGVWSIHDGTTSWLAVTHFDKRPTDDRTGVTVHGHRMDLYQDGVKRASDVALPGPVIGVSGRHLIVLTGEPPEGWTLSFLAVGQGLVGDGSVAVR